LPSNVCHQTVKPLNFPLLNWMGSTPSAHVIGPQQRMGNLRPLPALCSSNASGSGSRQSSAQEKGHSRRAEETTLMPKGAWADRAARGSHGFAEAFDPNNVLSAVPLADTPRPGSTSSIAGPAARAAAEEEQETAAALGGAAAGRPERADVACSAVEEAAAAIARTAAAGPERGHVASPRPPELSNGRAAAVVDEDSLPPSASGLEGAKIDAAADVGADGGNLGPFPEDSKDVPTTGRDGVPPASAPKGPPERKPGPPALDAEAAPMGDARPARGGCGQAAAKLAGERAAAWPCGNFWATATSVSSTPDKEFCTAFLEQHEVPDSRSNEKGNWV